MSGARPRRLLIATQYCALDRMQGADRLAWEEAVELARRGHDVTLVGFDPTGERPEETQAEGVRALRYRLPRGGRRFWQRATIHQAAVAARVRAAGGAFDAVHGHNVLLAAGAFAAARAGQPGGTEPRRVFTCHSPIADELRADALGAPPTRRLFAAARAWAAGRVERAVVNAATAVTADSAFVASLLGRRHPAHAIRIRRLRAWVRPDRFPALVDPSEARRRLGWEDPRPVLFTLRRLVPRMGLPVLLEAAARLVRRGVEFQLLIGGEGPLHGELARLILQLGLADRARLLGRLGETELPWAYAAADAFVLPTAALEGFGLIALESFLAGRPVLATPVGAIPEVVGTFEPAWLARDAGPDALADLLLRFLNGGLPRHAPEELRRHASANYGPTPVLDALEHLLAADPAG